MPSGVAQEEGEKGRFENAPPGPKWILGSNFSIMQKKKKIKRAGKSFWSMWR